MTSSNKKRSKMLIRSLPNIANNGRSKPEGKKRVLIHEFEVLFKKIRNIRSWAQTLLQDALDVVSLEDNMKINRYLEDSDKRHLGKTKLETLGLDMMRASKGSGIKGRNYAKALLKVGESELKLGAYGRDFVVDVCSSFVLPLKYFLEVELSRLMEEKEMLSSRKIDYEYHLKHVSGAKIDKNCLHKLKMAEMALEFQFSHAKDTLSQLDASACLVGHLSDLVNVQSMYHQKCLSELEKLKVELRKLNAGANSEVGDAPKFKEKSLVDRNICGEQFLGTPVCKMKDQNISCHAQDEPLSRKANECDTPIKSHQNVRKARNSQGDTFIGSPSFEGAPRSSFRHQLPVSCPVKTILFDTIVPERRINEKRLSNTSAGEDVSVRKTTACPLNPANNLSLEGSTTGSTTTSRETQMIHIPVRNNYKRNFGKIFFTPQDSLE